jgi:mannose-6-phosphate isomerase-like protein (cupin superfamily)
MIDMLPVYHNHRERLMLGTEEVTVVASNAETNGALFAVLLRMPPNGGPPVMHRHDPSEVYYVLEGEFTFYVQDDDGHLERRIAAAGETVPLAGRTRHTIRNESAADALAFVVHAPGAPMEGFLRAAAELATSGQAGMEPVLAIAAQHGIELLGPAPFIARS